MKLPTDRPILVTGVAGFIGFHVAERLLAEGHAVAGIDNLNPYYDPKLKEARLARLEANKSFRFLRGDLADAAAVGNLFDTAKPEFVIHLAAQAGVRYALDHPEAYVAANLTGFFHVLEAARRHRVRHFLYASSSSVYGAVTRTPFSEHGPAEHPLSFYGATKRANELMAHSYAHLHGLPVTGLRFFTVYGPWGRPDMAIYIFTAAILAGRPIEVVEKGEVERDFTYIDDVAEAVVRVAGVVPKGNPAWSGATPDPATSRAPFRLYNIGNATPVRLMEVVRLIEAETGKRAQIVDKQLPPGDMRRTSAATEDLAAAVGFRPATPLKKGIKHFVAWYRKFHGL
jgi:UDP-glucuronate 4-epimerase